MKFNVLFSLSSLLILATSFVWRPSEEPDETMEISSMITPVAISSVCVTADCSSAEIGLTGLTGLPCPCVPGLTDDIQVTVSFPLLAGGSVNLSETVNTNCESTVIYNIVLPAGVDCSGDIQLINVVQDPDNSDGAGTCPQPVPFSSLFVSLGLNPVAEVNGPYGPFCVDDPNIVLRGSPGPVAFQTGFWTGPGVTDMSVLDSVAIFDPELAGPGVHMIEYQFTDETGCIGMDTALIEVFESPLANAGDDTVFCANEVMQLSAAVSGGVLPYTILWTADNGSFDDPTDLEPDFIPGAAGVDQLVITVVDVNGCTSTDTVLVDVLEAPSVDPGGDTSVCTNNEIQFFANASGGSGPYVYSWIANGGTFDNAAIADPVYTNNTPGAYNITLFVIDQNGCQVDSTFEIIVLEAASIDLGGNQVLCSNGQFDFAPNVAGGQMPYTYAWTATGGTFDDPTSATPVYTNNTPGAYNITLAVTENGACTTTETIVMTVLDSIVLDMPDRFLTCEQSSRVLDVNVSGGTAPYTFQWSNTGGNFVDPSVEDATFQSAGPGLNLVTLVVTDAFGCQAVQSAIVEVGTDFTLDLGADANMCDNAPFPLNATPSGGNPPYTFSWVANGGSFDDASIQNPEYTNNTPGTYEIILSVTDSFGCSQMDTINITVNEGPIVDAGLDRTICNDEPIVLSPSVVAPNGPVTYLWTANGGGFSDATVPNPNYSSFTAGMYTLVLTVTDGFGCQASDSLQVLVNQEPFFQSCPDTLFFGTDQGQCGAFANWQAPVGLDHCNLNVTVTQTFGPAPGSMLLTDTIYRIEYTVEANNGTGNSATCGFFVVIQDTECPDFVAGLPQDVTIACTELPEPFEVVPEWHTTDNCTEAADISIEFVEDTTDITCDNSFVIKRYWTATDLEGNACTYTQKITINDTIAPSFEMAGDTTLSCQDLASFPMQISGASDNCTPDSLLIASFVDSTNQGASADSCDFYTYTIWRTYEVSDACGNSNAQTQRIDVVDNVLPTAICRVDTIYLNEEGYAITSVERVNDGSMDNCAPDSVLSLRLSRDTFTCADIAGAEIVLYALDPCGNEGACVTEIVVLDTFVPEILCPADQVITLAPGECSEVYHFSPFIEDNCEVSWTSVPASGSDLPIGQHTIEVTAIDSGGNTASCSFEVEILEFPNPITSMACNNQINISLDANCEASVNVDAVLEGGPYGCYDDFDLVITDPISGDTIEGPPHFGLDDINRLFTATVINPETGLSCWGTILVEQKLDPEMICPADTIIPCNHTADVSLMGMAEVTSCEPSFEVSFQDAITDNGACGTPRREIIRTWTVVDESENEVSCIQRIEIARFDLDQIEFPSDRSLPLDNAISCVEVGIDSSITEPEFTGMPMIQGNLLDPEEQTLCDFTMSYWDKVQPGCGNSFTILREWKITNVCEELNEGNPVIHVQLIHVVDDIAPVITFPQDVTLSAGSYDCVSSWSIPDPVVDDCSPFTFAVSTTAGEILDLTPGFVLTDLQESGAELTYVVEDFCGNIATHTIVITIVDDLAPTPVCDEFTVISLTTEGVAKAAAESFDDGSHDNCGPVYFKTIKKKDLCGTDNGSVDGSGICESCSGINGDDDSLLVGNQVYFDDYMLFCCEEVGQDVTVILRVFDVDPGEGPVAPSRMGPGGDLEGRFNDCEVTASVQDEIPPFLTCPPNITLSCDFSYDPEAVMTLEDRTFGTMVTNSADRQDVVVLGHQNPVFPDDFVWGSDGLAMDNCDVVLDIAVSEDISCGQGEIRRTFTATDIAGNENSCTQRVIFESFDPFGDNDILWPADVTISDVCVEDILSDDSFGGSPDYGADVCSDVLMSSEDEIFVNDADGCVKIFRHWSLIDWCQFDANTGEGEFEYTQVIIVQNFTSPTFENCEDVVVCDSLAEDCTTFVELVINATDDCTQDENLLYSYAIDYFHEDDGDPNDFDADVSSAGQFTVAEGGNDASGVHPFGVHRMRWFVEDGCGNVEVCEKFLDIRDCKAPTPKCFSGIVTVLMDVVGSVTIVPEDFDAGSTDNCGDVTLSFSEDVTDTELTLTCDDLGDLTLEIWVTDGFGNQAFCETFVFLQDNSGACNNASGTIGGFALTQNDEGLENVEARLSSDGTGMIQQVMTSLTGRYIFSEVPFGGSYTIDLFKNDDTENGISVSDILAIQSFLLGSNDLESPYHYLAADVNNDGAVTALDIVEIRRVLLGINTEFPNNTSWRFVDATQNFADPSSPWPFDEIVEVDNYSEDPLLGQDFVAVKVGDLNLNASTDGLMEIEDRSSDVLWSLSAKNVSVQGQEEVYVEITAERDITLSGLQLGLELNEMEMVDIRPGKLEVAPGMYHVSTQGAESDLRMVIDNETPVALKAGDVLWTMVLRSNRSGDLAESIDLGDFMANVYVDAEGLENGLGWKWTEDTYEAADLGWALYQNTPNPFQEQTVVRLDVAQAATVTYSCTSVEGSRVVREELRLDAGIHQLSFDASMFPHPGVYVLEVLAHDGDGKEIYRETQKMLLLQ